MTHPIRDADIPTDEELIRRARSLVPTLRARALSCQAQRRVPRETIDDFKAAGFFRILQAKAYGGYERSPLTLFRVLQIIGSGCPSSGWVLMVIAVHNLEMALMDARCSEEVWGEDSSVCISSSYVPFGKVVRAPGGYIASGRWQYSSGCDHCEWVLLGGLVETDAGPPEWKAFLIPRSDYTIDEESWKVFGLTGSGSKDITLNGDVFVPEYRAHFFRGGPQASAGPAGLSANMRIPLGHVTHYAMASAILGMAQGALDVFREQMRTRVSRLNPNEMAKDSPWVSHRIGHADVKVACARALIEHDYAEIVARLDAGEDVQPHHNPHFAYHASYVGRLAEEAVQCLFKAAGARAIRDDNLLQLYLRDVQAGAAHISMDADRNSVIAGAHSI